MITYRRIDQNEEISLEDAIQIDDINIAQDKFHDELMKKDKFFSSFKSYSSITHDGTLEYYRKSRDVNTYVALDRNTIVGIADFMVGKHPYSKGTFLDNLYLIDKYRGKGISSVLMSKILEESNSAGMKHVVLTVNALNKNAYAIYQKWGFTNLLQANCGISANEFIHSGVSDKSCSVRITRDKNLKKEWMNYTLEGYEKIGSTRDELSDFKRMLFEECNLFEIRDDQTSSFYHILGTDRFCVHIFEKVEKATLAKILLSFLHYNNRETGYIYAYQKDVLYKYLSFGYPMFNFCLSKKI